MGFFSKVLYFVILLEPNYNEKMSVLYINGDDTKNCMHGRCVVLLILFIVLGLYELERSFVNILKISFLK